MSPCAAVMVLPPGRAGVITGLSKAGVAAAAPGPGPASRLDTDGLQSSNCSGSRLGFDPHNDAHRAQSARSRDGQHLQQPFFSLFFEIMICTPPPGGGEGERGLTV